MRKTICLAIAILVAAQACAPKYLEVYDMKCEGLVEPLGIDSVVPHFSWKISSGKPACQTAYEIHVASSDSLLLTGQADLWQSGKVASPDQVMVPYSGRELGSRQACRWRVRVWDGNAVSEWSPVQGFRVGILDGMKGKYIGAAEGKGSALMRRKFNVNGGFKEAMLHVNSLGYHEVYLNGEKVSAAVLTPAVSQLSKHSLIMTYDVTGMLREGENDIVLWTSPGWYRKHFDSVYDGGPVSAELDIDGRTAVMTDEEWLGREGGTRDIGTWIHDDYTGEVINAMLVPKEFTGACLDKLEWNPVDTVSISVEAVPQMCEPCTIQETFQARSVVKYGDDTWLADMGRVVNGLSDITLRGLPAGHEVFVGFTDVEPENGQRVSWFHNILIASGEAEDTFTDRFTQHAFQYVMIENVPYEPKPEDIKVHRIRTDYRRISDFECSDAQMNAIHNTVVYTMENLAFDGYMVDCANLERLGYGGDGNASTLSLQTVFDTDPLYINWLRAWVDAQDDNGNLPHTAPSPHFAGGGPYWCSFIVQAPWRTFMNYGDPRPLERSYTAMKKWLEYAGKFTRDGLLYRWEESPLRKDSYIGDWLAPDGVDVTSEETVNLVSNCAMSQSYRDMAEAAGYLGHKDDSLMFAEKLSYTNKRIYEEFFHPESTTFGTGSQIDMAYPMLVGAVPEDLVEQVKESLFQKTESRHNNHLGVGLVGVPVLSEWAALSGSADFMYRMLKQTDYPGYLYMLENGATGIWESWHGKRTHLHNCMNGICSWFYQALGGIIPLEPGFRRIAINPQTPIGIDWVNVSEDTPYGEITVSWERKGGSRVMDVTLPVGVTAEICGKAYGCGRYRIRF